LARDGEEAGVAEPAEGADLLNAIIGARPGSALAALRAQRGDILRHTQGSHDVLLSPADPDGLSLAERALAAQRVAALAGHVALAAHYQTLLDARGAPATGPRIAAILAHAERLAVAPGSATKAHLAALEAVGLQARDIVALAQLVAFVAYQVRVAVALSLLAQDMAA
jgi:uncharacterized protein YciW